MAVGGDIRREAPSAEAGHTDVSRFPDRQSLHLGFPWGPEQNGARRPSQPDTGVSSAGQRP